MQRHATLIAASSTTQSVSTIKVRSAVHLARIGMPQHLLAQPPQQEERTRTQIAAQLRRCVPQALVRQATRRANHIVLHLLQL
jgi:hypothetical protein